MHALGWILGIAVFVFASPLHELGSRRTWREERNALLKSAPLRIGRDEPSGRCRHAPRGRHRAAERASPQQLLRDGASV